VNKVFWNGTLAWAIKFHGFNYALKLDASESILYCSFYYPNTGVAKLNASTGEVILSKSSPQTYIPHYVFELKDDLLLGNPLYNGFR